MLLDLPLSEQVRLVHKMLTYFRPKVYNRRLPDYILPECNNDSESGDNNKTVIEPGLEINADNLDYFLKLIAYEEYDFK